MSRFISVVTVLALQVVLAGSVCATPKAHDCCEGMDCTAAISCCTPSPVQNQAPQTGIQDQQNFSKGVTSSVSLDLPVAVLVVTAPDRTFSRSTPLFLEKQSFLI